MDLDTLTLGQIKELQSLFINEKKVEHPYKIGEKYAIRTVTMIYVGKLIDVYKDELVLEDCAWVADTGRFYNFLKDGTPNEVEPMPGTVIVGRGAIVDAAVWSHDFLREQK